MSSPRHREERASLLFGVTPADTKRVSLGKSTLTSALDRLESRGQIIRVRNPADRHSICIELTPRNETMHRLYRDLSEEMTRLFYAGFTPASITRFERDLRHIMDDLAACEAGHSPEEKEGSRK